MRIFAFLAALFLCGCASKPASVHCAETAKETVSAMVKALPKECQTDIVIELEKNAKAQIDSVALTCQTEKQELHQKIRTYQVLVWLVVVILVFVLKSKVS